MRTILSMWKAPSKQKVDEQNFSETKKSSLKLQTFDFQTFKRLVSWLLFAGLIKARNSFTHFGARKNIFRYSSSNSHTSASFPSPEKKIFKKKPNRKANNIFWRALATCLCLRCFSWTAFPRIVFLFLFLHKNSSFFPAFSPQKLFFMLLSPPIVSTCLGGWIYCNFLYLN